MQGVVGGQRRRRPGGQRRRVGVDRVTRGEQRVRLLGGGEMVRVAGVVVPVVARRVETERLHRRDRVTRCVGHLEGGHRGRPAVLRRLVAHRGASAGVGGDQRDQRLGGSAHWRVAETGLVPDRVGHALHTLGRAHRDRRGRHHTVGPLRRDELHLTGRRVVERRRQPVRVDDRRRPPHVVRLALPRDVSAVAEPVDAGGEVAVAVEVVGATIVVGQLVGVRHLTRTRPPRQDPRRTRELEVLEFVVLQPARLGRIEQVRPAGCRVHPLKAGDVDERAADAPPRPPSGPVDARRGPFLLPAELNRHVGGSLAVDGDERHRDRELAGALVDLAAETTVEGEPPARGGRRRLRRRPGRGQRHHVRHRPAGRPQRRDEQGERDQRDHGGAATGGAQDVGTTRHGGPLSGEVVTICQDEPVVGTVPSPPTRVLCVRRHTTGRASGSIPPGRGSPHTGRGGELRDGVVRRQRR